MKYSAEERTLIWDDDVGEVVVEIADDPDGLGMTEIRRRGEGNRITDRITFGDDALPLVIAALQKRVKS